ncbi:MAG TPA: hypothetical protein VL595_15160 [Pseudonocardia sp.]|nr:hypothetical protein [Pseudonocardia sp.]
MTDSPRPPASPSIVRALTTLLVRPPLALYRRLRSLVAGTGVLDSCETAGFTVRETGDDSGGFAVISGAELPFKVPELVDLAGSLREAGYLVELKAGDDEPCVLVSVPPADHGPDQPEDRGVDDHRGTDGPRIGVRSSHV